MSIIDTLIDNVIAREGGYVNNAADNGGPTKYGITLATLHAWRNVPVGAGDVAALTIDEARQIYRKNYFPAGFETIPDIETLEFLFDFGVNSGVGAAVRALQVVLKREGLYASAIDGDFGVLSRAALLGVKNWPALFYAVKCERYELLLRFIGSDGRQSIFATGWSNRLDQFEEKLGG